MLLTLDSIPAEIKGSIAVEEHPTLKQKINAISNVTEKQMIVDALNKANQNRTKAAELLGISRRTLQNKIKEYSL